MKTRRLSRGREAAGFTVIEMMVATAISLVVMGIVTTAVVEGQRSMNTVIAKEADIHTAQPVVDALAQEVRDASSVGIVASGSQLWIATTSGSCIEWVFSGSPGYELEQATGTGHAGVMSSLAVRLSGVTSGSFSYFSNYPGLVDVELSVLQNGRSSGTDTQAASSPAQLEVQVDDPSMSAAVTASYPGSC